MVALPQLSEGLVPSSASGTSASRVPTVVRVVTSPDASARTAENTGDAPERRASEQVCVGPRIDREHPHGIDGAHAVEPAPRLHQSDGGRIDTVSVGQLVRDVLQRWVRHAAADHHVSPDAVPRTGHLTGSCGAGERAAERDEGGDDDERHERQHRPC